MPDLSAGQTGHTKRKQKPGRSSFRGRLRSCRTSLQARALTSTTTAQMPAALIPTSASAATRPTPISRQSRRDGSTVTARRSTTLIVGSLFPGAGATQTALAPNPSSGQPLTTPLTSSTCSARPCCTRDYGERTDLLGRMQHPSDAYSANKPFSLILEPESPLS